MHCIFFALHPGPYFLNCCCTFHYWGWQGPMHYILSSFVSPQKNNYALIISIKTNLNVLHFSALCPGPFFLKCHCFLYCWYGNNCNSNFVFECCSAFLGCVGLVLFSFWGSMVCKLLEGKGQWWKPLLFKVWWCIFWPFPRWMATWPLPLYWCWWSKVCTQFTMEHYLISASLQ